MPRASCCVICQGCSWKMPRQGHVGLPALSRRGRCKPPENCWRQWALFCAFSGSCFGDRILGALNRKEYIWCPKWEPKSGPKSGTEPGQFVCSPNSVATLWGSYGNRKASGVNRWCALTRSAFLATLPVKSSPRDRTFAFRLRETGPRRGPFRRCVLACAPCRFSEIRKCAKREGFERCAKSS